MRKLRVHYYAKARIWGRHPCIQTTSITHVRWSHNQSHTPAVKSPEQVHSVDRTKPDKLDIYLDQLAQKLLRPSHNHLTPIETIYQQYRDEAGSIIPSVVPYEERPPAARRADIPSQPLEGQDREGDGIVLVVHALFSPDGSKLAKVVVCSGFVVDASVARQGQGDVIVTCAHTLLEMQRYLQRHRASLDPGRSFTFVLPTSGTPRTVTRLLSSMPRADAIVLEAHAARSETAYKPLRPLPLSPFPVYSGMPVLTHLFGSPDAPVIQHSIARTRYTSSAVSGEVENPISILDGHAYRRWGQGVMLGYRSYTGIEVEAGIHSSLPHILTSVLPTPGSSGGPLANAETGCVVGMISGRRMDNRVEGERGWGCSSEMLFEMFSLPGFTPTAAKS